MKFNGYHVLVWLGRLEDSHFIDLLLKGLDELAEFDYVDVSWNSWAVNNNVLKSIIIYLFTFLHIVLRVSSPKLFNCSLQLRKILIKMALFHFIILIIIS